jgi:hypothetical protein
LSHSCVALLTGSFEVVRSMSFHTCQRSAEKGELCLLLSQRAEVEHHFFSTSYTSSSSSSGVSSSSGWDPEALRRVEIKYAESLRELCESLAMLQTLPAVPDFVCIPLVDGLLPLGAGAGADFGAQAAVLHAAACIVDTAAYIAEHHKPVTVLVSSTNTSFDHFFQCLMKSEHKYVRLTAEPQADGSILCSSTEGQRKTRIVRHSNSAWEYC